MKALSCLIIYLLSFLTIKVSAQTEKTNKFEFSLSSGLSLPVASYGRKDVNKSAIYIINAPLPSVKGFDKGKSGFAKTGFDYNFEVSYKLSKSLKVLLRAGTFSNSVETNGMSEFLTQLYDGREIKVEEGAYKYLYITPGIGYYYSFKKFDFGLDFLVGYSVTEYPYYKFVYLFTTVNPPIIFAHLGPKPNLSSFTMGTLLSASYNITDRLILGINFVYQGANFKYSVQPSSYPGGGGTNFDYSDILKMKVLNTGFKLGYSF